MSRDSWPEPTATPEEWQRLFAAAEIFKAAEPWKWMLEEMLFAVENPETGELGFCSITGQLGEHRALIVYLGETGLGQYLTALHGMKYAIAHLQEQEHSLMLLETPQLQASFERRKQIGDLDRQIVKDLKLRIRGRDAWPIFRDFTPGRMPWYINKPQVRFLTVLLEQALIVAQAHHNQEFFANIPDVSTLPTSIPMTLRAREGDVWANKQTVIKPQYPIASTESSLDNEELAAWRRKLPLGNFEVQVHLTMLPMPVEEGESPPYFPYLLLVVETEQGLVLGAETILAQPALPDLWPQVLPKLLTVFERMEKRPQKAQVASERLYNLLAMPLGQLGIKLSRTQQMPTLEDALFAFQNWMSQH